MVVAETDFYKALSDPLQAIQDIYEEEGDKDDFTTLVGRHFQSLFSNNDARAKITPLTRSLLEAQLQPKSSPSTSSSQRLVRWRCMIQDTNLGSELMLRGYKSANGSWKNGLFGAASSEEGESYNESNLNQSDVNGTRLSTLDTLYGVSLPGQSPWSQMAAEVLDSSLDGDLLNKLQEINLEKSNDNLNFIKDKLPTGQEMGVLLKIYDEDLSASVRVAQAVDVIGILDQSTLPMGHWSALEGSETSSNLYPAMHVIAMQKVEIREQNKLSQSHVEVREALIDYLARGLHGDRLVAEWLLLSLIARIHTRSASHILGPLTLNISSFQSSTESPLSQLLIDILPLVASQSLELNHLNDKNTQFSPKSQADEGGLQAGRLQLVDGTLLLIDENTMQEGQLKENGIENIKVLSNLLTTKKLTYAFPYNNLEMETDINCLILSQGKSFLPFDIQIPLQPQERQEESASGSRTCTINQRTFKSQDYRSYLTTMHLQTSQTKQFNITNDISNQIQNDFVESRNNAKQESSGKTSLKMDTQEDLSRIIHVARLLCLSRGGNQLSWNDWEKAKSLDSQRLLRLQI